MLDIPGSEHFENLMMGQKDRIVEAGEQLESSRGDVAEDLPAIVKAALAPCQLLGLQPIDQPRDSGRLFDHPLGPTGAGQPA